MSDLDEECIHGLGPVAACVICNGRAKADEAREAEGWFVERWRTALYDGHCARCREPFSAGDQIGHTVGGSWVCEAHRLTGGR